MKRWLAVSLLVLSSWAYADAAPGMKQFKVSTEHQNQPVEAAVWYPTKQAGEVSRYVQNPVFIGVDVIKDAQPADKKYPLILLSHGMGGGLQPMAWLGTGLAKQGAIVMAAAHPGSTFSDFDPERLFNHWTRVEDLKAAIFHLEKSPEFSERIDWQRMYIAGFSYGGWTTLSMAGATGNLAGYQQHCKTVGEDGPGCDLFKEKGVDLTSFSAEQWDASYADKRVQGAVAIDPGLIYGLQPENVKHLIDNVTLIGLGEGKDRLVAADFSRKGSNFAALLLGANIVEIAPANHFTAMPMCQPEGEAILKAEQDDPVCTDPPGTNRAAVHARIIEIVAHAFGLSGK